MFVKTNNISKRDTDLNSFIMTLHFLFYLLSHSGQSGIAGIGYSNPPPLGKSRTTTFTFSPSFEEVPVITYGFEELDTDKDTNVRVKAYISDVTKTGFKMKLYTWGTSKTINIVASWMACPKFR